MSVQIFFSHITSVVLLATSTAQKLHLRAQKNTSDINKNLRLFRAIDIHTTGDSRQIGC